MDLMSIRRKMLMGQNKSRLPSEYQEVEYVESTGTQYIQTDVIPSNDLGFDCTFYTKSKISSYGNQYGCIFGGRKGSGNNDYQLTTYAEGNNGSHRYGPREMANAGITRLQKCKASRRYLEFTNCEGLKVQLTAYNWNTTIPIALFCLRDNTNHAQGGSGCRLYVMKFYDGDDLIRNYIPCIRKSDNVAGMFEYVTGQFLTTPVGTLTAGGEV